MDDLIRLYLCRWEKFLKKNKICCRLTREFSKCTCSMYLLRILNINMYCIWNKSLDWTGIQFQRFRDNDTKIIRCWLSLVTLSYQQTGSQCNEIMTDISWFHCASSTIAFACFNLKAKNWKSYKLHTIRWCFWNTSTNW